MKIEVKLNGEWREVIYVQGGYVDMYKDIDGVFASLRLKPKEEGGREGCTFTAITDIRLVDESEYEHEWRTSEHLPNTFCWKCGIDRTPTESECKKRVLHIFYTDTKARETVCLGCGKDLDKQCCEHEFWKINGLTGFVCRKCGVEDKPEKIEKLDWKIVEFNKGNMEMAGYIAKLSNKIDEIISHLIH